MLETLDNGKPIRESRDVDVPTASAHLFHHAGWADKLEYAGLGPDPRPLGVVGAVIPWNFPLLMAAWKIAPALACGNTIVLKPAETTPLTALVLAEIAAEAGLPAGVLNVLPGAGDVGSALVGHAGLDKVAFTGSTEVGKQIQRRLAGTGRRLTLELGGKAANIVYDDAPLDQAVEGVIDGIFFNQGHVCCAGSRLLVQESIADEFAELLRAPDRDAAGGRPAGQEHRRRRDQLGAPSWTGSSTSRRPATPRAPGAGPAPCPLPERGLFFPPTVFSGVEQTMRVAREEIFGPVLSVLTFRTPDEAVAKANNTPVRAVRRGLDREGRQGAVDGAADARRRGLDEHLQPLRPDRPVRRLPRVRLRPRGRPGRARRLPGCAGVSGSGRSSRRGTRCAIAGRYA